jgi:hypothetical protein
MKAELLQLRVLQRRVRGRINVTEANLQQAYRRAVREGADGAVARGMLGPAEPPPFADVRDRLCADLVNREMLLHRSLYLRDLRRTVGVDERLEVAPATR